MNNQEQAIVKTGDGQLVFTGELANDYNIAKTFIQSKFFSDVTNGSQAMVKIMAGRELGLQPFASMQGLYIVKGKIQISGNTIAGKIKAHPSYDYRVVKLDDSICELEFFENGESVGFYSFTYEKAKKIGLTTNSVWQNYPQTMLFNRAISGGYKIFCPDIFNFMVYTEADDIEDSSEATTVSEAIQQELANNIESAEVVENGPQVTTVDGKLIDITTGEIEQSTAENDEEAQHSEVVMQRPSDTPEEAQARQRAMEDIDRAREIQNKIQHSMKAPSRRGA
jgi:hypothetical protein